MEESKSKKNILTKIMDYQLTYWIINDIYKTMNYNYGSSITPNCRGESRQKQSREHPAAAAAASAGAAVAPTEVQR